MAREGGFFSPSAKKDNRIAGLTKKPLSPIGSDDYNKEVEGFIQGFKDDFNYRMNYDVDTGQPLRNFQPDPYRTEKKDYFGEEEMRRSYPYRRQFRYENWDGEDYTPGVPFGKKETETDTGTQVAGLFGYSDDEIERRKVLSDIINKPGYDPKSVTMFFDTCFSGISRDEKTLLASARPVRVVADETEDSLPKNFTIFSASQLDQISSGIKDAQHGIFSYFLMKGLEGNADLNKDNKITNGELLSYMDDKISVQASSLGREQNPSLTGDPNRVLVSFN